MRFISHSRVIGTHSPIGGITALPLASSTSKVVKGATSAMDLNCGLQFSSQSFAPRLSHNLTCWIRSVRLGRDDLYLNIDTGVGVLYVVLTCFAPESHSRSSYGEDLARVCHAFLYNTSFNLRDLIFEPPDESRASPPTRERKRKELETLVRFIKGLEVSVNFVTKRRYPRRKIVDVYPRAGRYKFILEKPGEGRREVTVEVSTIVAIPR